jgi:hypothetical protein
VTVVWTILTVVWTILTVVLVVICVLFLFMAPIFAGGKSLGQVQEIGTRLWTGLWKKEDADRLR